MQGLIGSFDQLFSVFDSPGVGVVVESLSSLDYMTTLWYSSGRPIFQDLINAWLKKLHRLSSGSVARLDLMSCWSASCGFRIHPDEFPHRLCAFASVVGYPSRLGASQPTV